MPQPFDDNELERSLKFLFHFAGLIVAAVAALVLLGWSLNIETLKSIVPGLVSMKINTAIGLMLLGVSLWLSRREFSGAPTNNAPRIVAAIAAAIGAISFLEYFVGNLGIDELLAKDIVTQGINAPGRMSPVTAISFVLTGSSILMVLRGGRGIVVSQILAVITSVVLLAVTLVYIFGGNSLGWLTHYSGVALHTIFLIFLLCLGILELSAGTGILKLFSARTAGGVIARRFVPLALLAPIAIGWLKMLGQRVGLYDSEFGTAVLVFITVVGLVFLIWHNARYLHRIDEQRKLLFDELENSKYQLQTIIDNAPAAIYVKDKGGRFLLVNRRVEENFQKSKAEILGNTSFDFLPANVAKELTKSDQAVLTAGHSDHSEISTPLPSGARTFIVLKFPLKDFGGTTYGLCGIATDITDRKQRETELARKNELIREHARKSELAFKELESFSYSVSHDLRAPLRSIDGFSQALSEDYADKLDAIGQDYLRRVRAASQRMAQLIDDMLQLSRVTRCELHLQPIDLSALASEIIQHLKSRHPQRIVEVSIQDGLKAVCDQRLIRVVLENLLDNAWKYTSRHPAAAIEFGMIQRSGTQAYFVKDDGAGFDMAYVNKLFGAFQRLHAIDEFEGTGIGLATVQRIVHRHGGEVWAEGAVEHGAIFFFTLEMLTHNSELDTRGKNVQQNYTVG